MTREEARKILTHNWTRVDNPNYSESELDEAFFMAIEALKEKKDDEPLLTDSAEVGKENECKLSREDARYFLQGISDMLSLSPEAEMSIDMAITALQGGDAEVNETKSPYMQHSRHDDGRMTRDDAILILGEFKEFCDSILWNSIYAERSRAIDMAIEALSADTSSDLISRANAIRWVKTECNQYGKPTLDYDSGLKVIEHLKKMPSELPSADAVQGEWVIRENGNKECSLCGHERQDGWDYFCGYCGARMKGGDAE